MLKHMLRGAGSCTVARDGSQVDEPMKAPASQPSPNSSANASSTSPGKRLLVDEIVVTQPHRRLAVQPSCYRDHRWDVGKHETVAH
jgi:hypothetical protein